MFLIFFAIYFFSSSSPTPYDYFTRLARSFISGKYYINENPAWLSELIPASSGRFYIPYPPGPAVLLIPFVLVFPNFQQQILAHILVSAIAILTILLSLKIKRDLKVAIWSGLLISIGTILWYMGSVGSSWYLGQITACFFLMLALYESLTKKRVWIVSISLGFCYLSRPHVILSLPFFLFLLKDELKQIRKLIQFIFPLLMLVGFDFFYNLIRFNVIWDKGYVLIPGVLQEGWFDHGIISPFYIRRNLETAFLSLPKFLPTWPFIEPSWNGLSILITTPVFIFSFWSKLKDKINIFCWSAIIPIFLVVLMHGTNGFAQFGYRFAVDFYPFLIFLTIKGVSKTGLKWYHWALLFVGIMVNFWGVTWINKFGWVGF